MKKNQELLSDLLPLVAGGGGVYLVYKYIIEPAIKRTPVIPGRTPIDIPLEDSLVLEEPAESGWGIDNVMPIVKILREAGIPANMETRPLRFLLVGQIATQYRLIVFSSVQIALPFSITCPL